MNKRKFLKTTDLLGVGVLSPFQDIMGKNNKKEMGCTLILTETAGVFPLDLTEKMFF